MPRVANPPAGKGRTAASVQTMATPHKQSPVKLALNDDRGEKAARLQSRQALQEVHMNTIKAAASPMRKLNNYDRAASESPRTPKSAAAIARQRKTSNGDGVAGGSSPRAPIHVVDNSAATPMKRVPILANFEEWMKMATDNKINAANSWNFALIDYFHDMSLLKEGDGVNFQKASCTLDGCVKIYTSRVDSVATETGKLLSGLADSGNIKKAKERAEGEVGEGEDGEDEDDGGEGEDGVKKKTKKKTQRTHEATLAPSFASLQLKKMELEFAVDPLFKKASADFDEGGAKGLLLNHLTIDSEGRIVFDSSDDAGDAAAGENTKTQETDGDVDELSVTEQGTPAKPRGSADNHEIDIDSLAAKFFPDLSILDSQDICPSMKSFALDDPNSDLNISVLKPPEDWRDANKDKTINLSGNLNLGDQTGIFLDGANAAGFEDDDDGGLLGGFDLPPETGFGEGGEAWAKEAALEPMLRVSLFDEDGQAADGAQEGVAVGDFDPSNPRGDAYAVSLNHHKGSDHGNILSYFDNALKSQRAGWAGHEHWRIRKIKEATAASENPAPVRQRKEKEPFEIDFLAPMSQSTAEIVYTMASSNSAISLPKAQWKTKGRNLLPDDRHFNSRSLLSLFLKPKARLGRRNNVAGLPARGNGNRAVEEDKGRFEEMDEAYWARRKEDDDRVGEEAKKQGDYDANFFADDDAGLPFVGGIPDDDDDDDDGDGPAGFTDAREMLSPPPLSTEAPTAPADSQAPQSQTEMLPGSFGSQLVTQGGRRLRPEYVNYARVAKKVDVRRLKENMWKGMSESLMASFGGSIGRPAPAPAEPDGDVDMMDIDEEPAPPPTAAAGEKTLDKVPEMKFTDMIGDLRKVYPEQQMRDISTSYCFICLLHLANEKGLVLDGGREEEGMQEIVVRKDISVGEGYVGE